MANDLLLTVSIGDDKVAQHTVPRMNRYAVQYDAEFRVMSRSALFQRPVFAYWEELIRLCDTEYDRIAILDSDILIRNGAPNLFSVPFDHIAMKPSGWVAPRFLRRIRANIATDFQIEDMFNTGVILMTRDYIRKIAAQIEELCGVVEETRFADQVYFCNVVKQSLISPTPLSWRWNQYDLVPNFRAVASHFLHFRGKEKLPRVTQFLARNPTPEWGDFQT